MAEITANQKALVGYMKRSDQHAAHGFELILKNERPEDFFDELRKAGLFDATNNPKPQPIEGDESFFRIPYWSALSYLKRAAAIARATKNDGFGNKVMEVVRAIAGYRDGHSTVDNFHTYSELAEILGTLPTACVTLADVDVVQYFLASRWNNSMIVPALDRAMQSFLASPEVEDHSKAVRLLEHVTQLKAITEPAQSFRTSATVADPYWLEQLLMHNAKALGEKGNATAMDCLCTRLRQLFGGDYIATHTWLWRPAIENHEQNREWDHITNAFVHAVTAALSAWLQAGDAAAVAYVFNILRDEAQIVRRIAIHTVRCNWAALETVFSDSLSRDLFEIGHLHELYILLRERFEQLNRNTQQRVFDIISALADEFATGTDERERAEHRQRNWLDAIKGLGCEPVDREYQRLTLKLGPLREHPDLLSYHQEWFGTGPSPYSADELVAFAEDKSLIKRVDSFVPPNNERRSSRKSLIDTLITAVKAHPLTFIWTLDPAVETARPTQYGLINGYAEFLDVPRESEAYRALPTVLNEFLPYLVRIVGSKEFWREPIVETGEFEPNKNWIPRVVVEAARKIVSNDDLPLDDEQFQQLLSAIIAVKDNTNGIDVLDDPMTAAINNSRGIAVEALLQFVLRRCRDEDKTDGGHEKAWQVLRVVVEDELRNCKDGRHLEASTIFASSLAQLLYVNANWVRENMVHLFPFAHKDNFMCALAGLSFANMNPRVYAILKEADVPRTALRLADVIKDSSRERLIERVALAYIWGKETLDSQIIKEMFSDTRIEDLAKLTNTIAGWSRKELTDDNVTRAKALAAAVTFFDKCEPPSRRKLLTATSRFIAFITNLNDDDLRWLTVAAPFAHSTHGEDSFLEALDSMFDASAEKALAVLDAFLRDYAPRYDYRDHLPSIIRKLDAAGFHIRAVEIVNQMVKSGAGLKWVGLYKELVGTAPSADID